MSELAALLRVSSATVYHLCEVGAVRHVIAGHAIAIAREAVRDLGVPDVLIRRAPHQRPARLLTAVEAAQRLRVDTATVARMCQRDENAGASARCPSGRWEQSERG